jgi:hypothetical protein
MVKRRLRPYPALFRLVRLVSALRERVRPPASGDGAANGHRASARRGMDVHTGDGGAHLGRLSAGAIAVGSPESRRLARCARHRPRRGVTGHAHHTLVSPKMSRSSLWSLPCYKQAHYLPQAIESVTCYSTEREDFTGKVDLGDELHIARERADREAQRTARPA